MFIVKRSSRYHPYYKETCRSTLTDKTYSRSVKSYPLDRALHYCLGRQGTYSPCSSTTSDIRLNEDQTMVMERLQEMLEGNKSFHVFVSGPAGTGKSVVLHRFSEAARVCFGSTSACLVVAFTGSAAVNVNGSTIHTALKILPGVRPFTPLQPHQKEQLKQELSELKVLIIDEISFVTSTMLTQIDHRLREVFENDEDFGGKSVVAFGDLLQLPPVSSGGESSRIFTPLSSSLFGTKRDYSPSVWSLWNSFKLLELRKNERTKERKAAKVLSAIRLGNQDENIRGYLHHHCRMEGSTPADVFRELRRLQNDDPDKSFMVIAPTNSQVEELNNWKIGQTKNCVTLQPHTKRPSYVTKTFFRRGVWKDLKLAVGSKVVVTENVKFQAGIVNGLLGTVVKVTEHTIILKRSDNGRLVGVQREPYQDGKQMFYQFPMALAEAITIHKSQGTTFDGVIVVTESLFEVGGFYTAISRARDLKLTRITDVMNAKWRACPRSLAQIELMNKYSKF